MNPLRIFTRLLRLEERADRCDDFHLSDAFKFNDERASLRPMLHAIRRRFENIESSLVPCARCRSILMLDQRVNEHGGPQVMERSKPPVNGSPRIVVCWWCEAAARRDGWRHVELPKEAPAPEVASS